MKRHLVTSVLGFGIVLVPAPVSPFGPQPSTLTPFTETLPKAAVKIAMVPVPGGTVTVGGKPVRVAPFYIARTETAWEAYDAFAGSGPPSKPYDQTLFAADAIARPSRSYILPDLGWGHNGFPVINASFETATMFCRWLSSVSKRRYRLPTEAEWELACRAGDPPTWKPTKAELDAAAWYAANAEDTTHPVGKKAANKLGLHDMLGNAGEWATDAEGKPVLCGGTFLDPVADCTPTRRQRWSPEWQETDPQMPKSRWWLADAPFVGFRVVCEP